MTAFVHSMKGKAGFFPNTNIENLEIWNNSLRGLEDLEKMAFLSRSLSLIFFPLKIILLTLKYMIQCSVISAIGYARPYMCPII
jgi:hypothetical protein